MQALLDPTFTASERRWGDRIETALWVVSVGLLVAMVAWSL
jgi:hypothetical protein